MGVDRTVKVYAGHIIPLMPKEGERIYYSEFTKADYNEFKNLLKQLKQRLKEYVRSLERRYGQGGGIELGVKLKAIGDFIVAFFMIPLSLPLYPRYNGKVYFPSPQEYYWVWVLSRHVPVFASEIWNKPRDLAELVRVLHERLADLAELTGIGKLIGSVEEADKVFNLIIKIPADTRPGLNTSKLIVHLLSTSALAVCKGLHRGLPDYKIGILRLASLLHDIGKPDQWFSEDPTRKHHAEYSAIIAEDLLADILDYEVVEKIKTLILFHHRCNDIEDVELRELCSILSEADSDSSSIDRVVDVVVDAIAKKLNINVKDVEDKLKGVGPSVWKWWFSLGDDRIKELTDTTARMLSREPLKIEPTEDNVVKGVRVVFCDLRRIQEYINVESLRALAIRSFLVDLATVYAIPRAVIEEFNVNPENIVYAGGGFVIVIVPEGDSKKHYNIKRRYERICGLVGGRLIVPQITIALSPLYRDWRTTFEKAVEELHVEKYVSNSITSLDIIGFEKLCETCGKYPAVAGNQCEICRKLDEAAYELYFKKKIDALGNLGFKVPEWDVLKEWMMEWLSGNSISKSGVVDKRVFSVSIVKVDGNFIGAFMRDAISISDAFERSIRIDRALKSSIHRLLALLRDSQSLIKKFSEEDSNLISGMCSEGFTRVYTGILYAGGDDALLVIPTWIALPASLYIAYWFWRGIGGVRQLSIAIASGKPKHNIWGILEASTHILDNVCKSRFRREIDREYVNSRNVSRVFNILDNTIAVLGFVYSEQQNLMRSIVEGIVSHVLVKQPYILEYKETGIKLEDIKSILGIVLADRNLSTGSLEEWLERFLVESYKAFHSARCGKDHITVNVRNVVFEVHSVASGYGDVETDTQRYMVALSAYIARQRARLEREPTGTIYSKIAQYIGRILPDIIGKKADLSEALPPLYDIYMLTKMLMGGAR